MHMRAIVISASIRAALAGMPILRACEDAVLDVLEEGAQFVRFGSGASVFERGSMPTGLFFVHAGAVRLMSLCPEGRPKVVEIFEPGGMFGEIGVFTGHCYRTWTQAIGASVLIHVPRERMLEAVASTAVETIATVQAIKDLLHTTKQRIRGHYKFYSQDLINNLFNHPYTRVEFAQRELGVSRITATRYLDKLAEDGVLDKIRIGRNNYYVNRPLFDLLSSGDAGAQPL